MNGSVAKARALILEGKPVYQAVSEAGLSLSQWYYLTDEKERHHLKVKRLKNKRELLLEKLAKVDADLAALSTEVVSDDKG